MGLQVRTVGQVQSRTTSSVWDWCGRDVKDE